MTSVDGFAIANVTELTVPGGLSYQSMDWGVGGSIGGATYEFVFSWNPRSQCYSMRITGTNGFSMKRYLTDGWSIPIKNFAPQAPAAYDAIIGFYDEETGEHAKVRPSNISSGRVKIIVLRGVFI